MRRNHTITNSAVILLTGAGASASLNKPMMAEFLATVTGGLDHEQAELLGTIRHFRGNDLEAIQNDIDSIIDLQYLQSASVLYVPAGPHQGIPGMDPAPPSLVVDRIRRETAIRLKESLEREIITEYSSVDQSQATSLYRTLLERLSQGTTTCLPIFTTNYDPAIERFYEANTEHFSLTDGFRHHAPSRSYYWDSSTFDQFVVENGKRNLVLFKIHGSADWIRRKSDQKILRTISIHDSADRNRYENVIIYPAMRKVTTREPYFTGYDYFQRCCERARVCIVIGYSFRDYEVLTRLMSVLQFNESLRVAVLDPRADELISGLPWSRDRVVTLPYRFGDQNDEGVSRPFTLSGRVATAQNSTRFWGTMQRSSPRVFSMLTASSAVFCMGWAG